MYYDVCRKTHRPSNNWNTKPDSLIRLDHISFTHRDTDFPKSTLIIHHMWCVSSSTWMSDSCIQPAVVLQLAARLPEQCVLIRHRSHTIYTDLSSYCRHTSHSISFLLYLRYLSMAVANDWLGLTESGWAWVSFPLICL